AHVLAERGVVFAAPADADHDETGDIPPTRMKKGWRYSPSQAAIARASTRSSWAFDLQSASKLSRPLLFTFARKFRSSVARSVAPGRVAGMSSRLDSSSRVTTATSSTFGTLKPAPSAATAVPAVIYTGRMVALGRALRRISTTPCPTPVQSTPSVQPARVSP